MKFNNHDTVYIQTGNLHSLAEHPIPFPHPSIMPTCQRPPTPSPPPPQLPNQPPTGNSPNHRPHPDHAAHRQTPLWPTPAGHTSCKNQTQSSCTPSHHTTSPNTGPPAPSWTSRSAACTDHDGNRSHGTGSPGTCSSEEHASPSLASTGCGPPTTRT